MEAMLVFVFVAAACAVSRQITAACDSASAYQSQAKDRPESTEELRSDHPPRADETALDGAAAWASAGWSIAHISAVVGPILIPLGYGAIRGFLGGRPQERTSHLAAVIGYIGSGLTVSYYGAEVYGPKAIASAPWPTANPA